MINIPVTYQTDNFGDINDASDNIEMRKRIVNDLLKKFTYDEIQSAMKWRNTFEHLSQFLDVTQKCLYVSTTALTFVGVSLNSQSWLFASATVGTLANAFLILSSFASKKAQDNTILINRNFDKLNIAEIPNIVIEDASNVSSNNQNTQKSSN